MAPSGLVSPRDRRSHLDHLICGHIFRKIFTQSHSVLWLCRPTKKTLLKGITLVIESVFIITESVHEMIGLTSVESVPQGIPSSGGLRAVVEGVIVSWV